MSMYSGEEYTHYLDDSLACLGMGLDIGVRCREREIGAMVDTSQQIAAEEALSFACNNTRAALALRQAFEAEHDVAFLDAGSAQTVYDVGDGFVVKTLRHLRDKELEDQAGFVSLLNARQALAELYLGAFLPHAQSIAGLDPLFNLPNVFIQQEQFDFANGFAIQANYRGSIATQSCLALANAEPDAVRSVADFCDGALAFYEDHGLAPDIFGRNNLIFAPSVPDPSDPRLVLVDTVFWEPISGHQRSAVEASLASLNSLAAELL